MCQINESISLIVIEHKNAHMGIFTGKSQEGNEIKMTECESLRPSWPFDAVMPMLSPTIRFLYEIS
jgi:hypothetical protein